MDKEVTPYHVPCRHCGKPISWDEICWVHDRTGFADCGLTVGGSDTYADVVLNPKLKITGPHKGKKALPIGEWH